MKTLAVMLVALALAVAPAWHDSPSPDDEPCTRFACQG